MLINENVALRTSKIILVPYCEHHVSRYHIWMQDPDIQEATASEPLSIEEEHAMQRTWRLDSDKLTFICCRPPLHDEEHDGKKSEIDRMVGDVNLFISFEEEDDSLQFNVGELELMIAEKTNQKQGLGRASLLTFLNYISKHEARILNEFNKTSLQVARRDSFDYLRVRINHKNQKSLNLFESIGFVKVKSEPNFFGELELRLHDLNADTLSILLESADVHDYVETTYSIADREE